MILAIGMPTGETVHLEETKTMMITRLTSGAAFIFHYLSSIFTNRHLYIFSADEATERRDTPSGRESKSSGRFGGEFRDSDEAPKRQEKEFRFDVDKQKSVSAKPTKKVDLGAAAFYKVDPIPGSSVIYFYNNVYICMLRLFNQQILIFRIPQFPILQMKMAQMICLQTYLEMPVLLPRVRHQETPMSWTTLIREVSTAEQMETLGIFPVPFLPKQLLK